MTPPYRTNILILGGTREAAELAAELVKAGYKVTTSLAGRTREPKPVAGEIRIGGFGGAKGLADYLKVNSIDKLIDATHPFARQVSANAIEAASLANVPLEVKTRPQWQREPGDNWIEVASEEEACRILPDNARAFLALGSQHIGCFASRTGVFFVIRMVDEPPAPLPFAGYKLLVAKPSDKWQEEMALLKAHAITHLVCRNSGGKAAYAKIIAARELGLPVVMIGQEFIP